MSLNCLGFYYISIKINLSWALLVCKFAFHMDFYKLLPLSYLLGLAFDVESGSVAGMASQSYKDFSDCCIVELTLGIDLLAYLHHMRMVAEPFDFLIRPKFWIDLATHFAYRMAVSALQCLDVSQFLEQVVFFVILLTTA